MSILDDSIMNDWAAIEGAAHDASGGMIDINELDLFNETSGLIDVPKAARLDKKNRHQYAVEFQDFEKFKGQFAVISFYSLKGSGGHVSHSTFETAYNLHKGGKVDTDEQRQQLEIKQAEAKAKAKARQEKEKVKKMDDQLSSLEQWQQLEPVSSSDYFSKKGLAKAHNILDVRSGCDYHGDFIAVPLTNGKGEQVGFERIYQDNSKKSSKGCPKNRYLILQAKGEKKAVRNVLLTEGIADALTVYAATGCKYTVLACIGLANLIESAKLLENKDGLTPIVCLDNDASLRDTLEKLRGLVFLRACYPSYYKDYNDLYVAKGLDAVKHQLAPRTPKQLIKLEFES